MASSSSDNKMYKLRSSDGEVFEVEESVAIQSVTIKKAIGKSIADSSIVPLPNVTSEILAKVVEFCKRHVEGAVDDEAELKRFDAEFVKVDQKTLYDLIMAADYLNIKSLLDLTCQSVADMIKGRPVQEIQRIFKIENDVTPEEQAQLCDTHDWLFESIYGESKYGFYNKHFQ